MAELQGFLIAPKGDHHAALAEASSAHPGTPSSGTLRRRGGPPTSPKPRGRRRLTALDAGPGWEEAKLRNVSGDLACRKANQALRGNERASRNPTGTSATAPRHAFVGSIILIRVDRLRLLPSS